MKKTLSLILCLALLLTINLSAAPVSAAEDPFDGFSKITLTPGADNSSMNFSWLVEDSQSQGVLEIVKKSELGVGFPCESAESITVSAAEYRDTGYLLCKADISGLEPATEYAYRYGDTVKWSNTYSFSTLADYDGRFTAVYLGDPQLGVKPDTDDEGFRSTVKNTFKTAPDAKLVISAGDQDNSESTLEKQIRNYSAFFSPEEFSSVAVSTVMGNHENKSKYTQLYDRFNNPNATEYGSMMGGSDYYYKFGNTLFINLNCGTESLQTDIDEHGKAIKEATEKYPDTRWRVIVMHFDIYGTGKYHSQADYMINYRNGMVPYIEKYNIDIVFSGHEHLYSRSYFLKGDEIQIIKQDDGGRFQNPNGTVYIAANSSSGNKFYDSLDPRPYYINKYIQEYRAQYNIVTFEEDQLIFKSYFADTNEIADSFAIVKSEALDKLITETAAAEGIDLTGRTSIAAENLKLAAANAKEAIKSADGTSAVYDAALSELKEAEERFEREKESDIYASAVELQPGSAADGDYIYFTAVVRNTGDGYSTEGIPIDFYLDGQLVASESTGKIIESGKMLRVTCSVPYRAAFGMHTVSVKMDSNGQFEELDSGNNAIKKKFIVEG